jgi:acyl carrier protein
MSPSSKLHYCNEEMYPELGEHAHEKANMNNSSAMMRRPNQLRRKRTSRKHNKSKLIRVLVHKILDSIPLSILLDLLESTFDLSIDTTFAFGKLSINTLHNLLTFLSNTAFSILSSLSSINIFELALSAHRSVNKTGEVLASGLQSVATGVGSASNAALERLSRQGLALAGAGLSRGGGGVMRGGSGGCGVVENPLESKVREIVLTTGTNSWYC